MSCLLVPLSTLHPFPHDNECMTRGQVGLLFLSCKTLSFLTSCRFIPAHSALIRSKRSWLRLLLYTFQVASILVQHHVGHLAFLVSKEFHLRVHYLEEEHGFRFGK